jgi:hypothetical protein
MMMKKKLVIASVATVLTSLLVFLINSIMARTPLFDMFRRAFRGTDKAGFIILVNNYSQL